MNVSIPGALTLRRNTEYCQWQEIQSQRCETCTRTVRANDGSTKDERYKCNCVKQYNYVKRWRNHRINSFMFDQPGAHHNPQRDPMPSRMFVGQNAKLTFHEGGDSVEDNGEDNQNNYNKKSGKFIQASLNPNMLTSGIRNQPHRRIEFTPNGYAPPPSFFARFFSFLGPSRRTRFEPLNLLKDTPNSRAAIQDNFVYVNQGGYFFSPHESTTASKLFNYFTQYMEGSLFDWQFGDFMPSCTAGDIRFYYEVQDPTTVSVLGQLAKNDNIALAGTELQIVPRTMNGIGNDAQAATIGLVHAGRHSAEAMLMAEDSDSKNKALIIRAVFLLWSIPASRLLGVAFGRELGDSSFTVQAEGVIGLFFTLLGAVWLLIWGETFGSLETTVLFFMGGTLGYLCYKSSARRSAGSWYNAVWCRIGQWANVPPEWRVEDSYVPSTSKVGTGGPKVS